MYIQRFYLQAEPARIPQGDDQHVLTSALYIAIKVYDLPISLRHFLGMLSTAMSGTTSEASTAYEIELLQAMDFCLVVHSPFKTLEVVQCHARESLTWSHLLDPKAVARDLAWFATAAPALLCYPPQAVAAAAALCWADSFLSQQQRGGSTAADGADALPLPPTAAAAQFSALPSIEHVMGCREGSATVCDLLSSLAHSASLHFSTEGCAGVAAPPPAGSGRQSPADAEAEYTRGLHSAKARLLFPKAVSRCILEYAGGATRETRALLSVSKAACGVWAEAWWACSVGGGGGGEDTAPPVAGVSGFHLGEVCLLRRVALSLAYTGRAEVKGWSLSRNAVSALRQAQSSGASFSISLRSCNPASLE